MLLIQHIHSIWQKVSCIFAKIIKVAGSSWLATLSYKTRSKRYAIHPRQPRAESFERASNYLKKEICIYSTALPRFLYKILILFISPFIELSSIILFPCILCNFFKINTFFIYFSFDRLAYYGCRLQLRSHYFCYLSKDCFQPHQIRSIPYQLTSPQLCLLQCQHQIQAMDIYM